MTDQKVDQKVEPKFMYLLYHNSYNNTYYLHKNFAKIMKSTRRNLFTTNIREALIYHELGSIARDVTDILMVRGYYNNEEILISKIKALAYIPVDKEINLLNTIDVVGYQDKLKEIKKYLKDYVINHSYIPYEGSVDGQFRSMILDLFPEKKSDPLNPKTP